jgi:molybdenum cofactor biosynthesis protein B
MSDAVTEHRAAAPTVLRLAVLTVSDTRTIDELASAAGHSVVDRAIVPDEPARMRPLLEAWRDREDLDAALLTGGTGISPRDQTFETVSSLLTRPLPGYGELFRMLSFAEIGPAAMLSRAVGGLMGRLAVMVMPGSRAAVKLAMEKLILPELGHVVREARK